MPKFLVVHKQFDSLACKKLAFPGDKVRIRLGINIYAASHWLKDDRSRSFQMPSSANLLSASPRLHISEAQYYASTSLHTLSRSGAAFPTKLALVASAFSRCRLSHCPYSHWLMHHSILFFGYSRLLRVHGIMSDYNENCSLHTYIPTYPPTYLPTYLGEWC